MSRLSVIIPVLNAAVTLPACLAALQNDLVTEIIVVDGGSTDGTAAPGAKVLRTPPGRGGQLRAGTAAAQGDFLLLLHADTILAPNWSGAAQAAFGTPNIARYFRFRLNSGHPFARLIEVSVALRCRFFTLPYGDQGLVISRTLLDEVGGVPDLPLMEDVALARRLRGRLKPLAANAVTSATRYERGGWLRRTLRNLLCLTLYLCGVPPSRILKIYG